MAERIWNIVQTPPGMPPLKPSPKVEGMLCFFKDVEEDEDRSVSQKKSGHKERREDSPQDTKNGGIRSCGQKQDDPSGPAEYLQEDKQNKKDLKSWNKNEKEGKDERVEGERKYSQWNSWNEKEGEEDRIKEKESAKVPQCDNA